MAAGRTSLQTPVAPERKGCAVAARRVGLIRATAHRGPRRPLGRGEVPRMFSALMSLPQPFRCSPRAGSLVAGTQRGLGSRARCTAS